MQWLSDLRDRHRTGYRQAGICLSCRRKSDCPGGRIKNDCSNHWDNTPSKEEYLQQYADLLKRLFAAEGEPLRGDRYGAAQSRRKFLRYVIGIGEEELRTVEDMQHIDKEMDRRDLRRLRWEL